MGVRTAHDDSGKVRVPFCSSSQGTHITSLTVKAGAVGWGPLVMCTAGIWGHGPAHASCRGMDFSPVMKVTALQNAHSQLTRLWTRPDRAAGCRKSREPA